MFNNILKVASTNIFKLLVSFLIAFVFPKILTVEDFGYFKLYQFYCAYIGITHLGFVDGVYLKYGGFKLNEIKNDNELSIEGTSLLAYELLISIILICIGFYFNDFIILLLGLVTLPMNMSAFFSYVYQALGEFAKYSKILSSIFFYNFLAYGILLILNISKFLPFVYIAISTEYLSFLLFIYSFKKNFSFKFVNPKLIVLLQNMRMGILLTIGNIIYVFFLGIDKWFIRYSLSVTDFAMYSFAGQMVTLVNMFISPISTTLYAYMSQRKNQKFEIGLKRKIITLLMGMPFLIFLIDMVICAFLPDYYAAKPIVSILLIAQIFWGLNSAIFINLYKVYKQQKQYFSRMCISLAVAFILNVFVMQYHSNLLFYAFATLFSILIWTGLNLIKFSYLKPDVKELLLVASLFFIYITTLHSNILFRFIIYLIAYIVSVRVLMHDIVSDLFTFLKSINCKNS